MMENFRIQWFVEKISSMTNPDEFSKALILENFNQTIFTEIIQSFCNYNPAQKKLIVCFERLKIDEEVNATITLFTSYFKLQHLNKKNPLCIIFTRTDPRALNSTDDLDEGLITYKIFYSNLCDGQHYLNSLIMMKLLLKCRPQIHTGRHYYLDCTHEDFVSFMNEIGLEEREQFLNTPKTLISNDFKQIKAASNDDIRIKEFEALVGDWIYVVEDFLLGIADRIEVIDEGPLAELKYWLLFESILHSIIEQLKGNHLKAVISTLTIAKSKVMKQWKVIDASLTEASNEAKDKIKYLRALQNCFEFFYNPENDIMKAINIIFPKIVLTINKSLPVSRFYSKSGFLGVLISKLSNQVLSMMQVKLKNAVEKSLKNETISMWNAIWGNRDINSFPHIQETDKCSSIINCVQSCLEFYSALQLTVSIIKETLGKGHVNNHVPSSFILMLIRRKQINNQSGNLIGSSLTQCQSTPPTPTSLDSDLITMVDSRLSRVVNGIPFSMVSDYSTELDAFKDCLFCILHIFNTINQFSALIKTTMNIPVLQGSDELKREDPSNSLHNCLRSAVISVQRFLKISMNDSVSSVTNSSDFQKEYISFLNLTDTVDDVIRLYIKSLLDCPWRTIDSLQYLEYFKPVRDRPALKDSLYEAYSHLLDELRWEIERIQDIYETQKEKPPLNRNAPPISGRIVWARGLFQKIRKPIEYCKEATFIFENKESIQIFKSYNILAFVLIKYEELWLESFQATLHGTAESLKSNLLRRNKDGELEVNISCRVFECLAELKVFQRLKIAVGPIGLSLLKQEKQLKQYRDHITHILTQFYTTHSNIPEPLSQLCQPLIKIVLHSIQPALATITWSTVNIDAFLSKVYNQLEWFSSLVDQMRIISNQNINSIIDKIKATIWIDMRNDSQIFKQENFYNQQKELIIFQKSVLKDQVDDIEKNLQNLLTCIHDLCAEPSEKMIRNPSASISSASNCRRALSPTHTSKQIGLTWLKIFKIVNKESVLDLYSYYCSKVYHAVRCSIMNSLELLMDSFKADATLPLSYLEIMNESIMSHSKVMLKTEVEYNQGCVSLSPSVANLQTMINTITGEIVSITRNLYWWATDISCEFYASIMKEKDIVDVCDSLSHVISDWEYTSQNVLSSFKRYDFLQQEPNQLFSAFVETCENTQELHVEISRLRNTGNEVLELQPYILCGTMAFDLTTFKYVLSGIIQKWIICCTKGLHNEVKSNLFNEVKQRNEFREQLQIDVNDLMQLIEATVVIDSIENRHHEIESRYRPIEITYETLRSYGVPFPKEELLVVSSLRDEWQSLADLTQKKRDDLLISRRLYFEQEIDKEIKSFQLGSSQLCQSFLEEVEQLSSCSSETNYQRLLWFENRFEELTEFKQALEKSKMIFGEIPQSYKELTTIGKILKWLLTIYDIHKRYSNLNTRFIEETWGTVDLNFYELEFQHIFAVCERNATENNKSALLSTMLSDVETQLRLIPLMKMLKQKEVKPRHWNSLTDSSNLDDDILTEDLLKDLKVKNVIDLNLTMHASRLQHVVGDAKEEHLTEKEIKLVSMKWNKMEVPMVVVGDEFNIVDRERMTSLRVECRMASDELCAMLQSQHAKPCLEVISNLELQLRNCDMAFEKVLTMQEIWSALNNIMSDKSISEEYFKAASCFAKVEAEFFNVMSDLKNKKYLLKIVENISNFEMLITNTVAVSNQCVGCIALLADHIARVKQDLPKLNFVSDLDVLKLCSFVTINELNGYIRLLYPEIDGVILETNNILTENVICGIQSVSGEVIKLETDLLVSCDKGYLTLKTLQDNLRKTLKVQLKDFIKDYNDNIQFSILMLKYSSQICYTAVFIVWTRSVETAIHELSSDKKAIIKVSRRFSTFLNTLINLIHPLLQEDETRNGYMLMKYQQVLSLIIDLRDVTEKLSHKRVKGCSDLDWQRQLRCYLNQSDDSNNEIEVTVRMLDAYVIYGFDFVDIIQSPVSMNEKVSSCLIKDIHENFNTLIEGPFLSGKATLIKNLSYLCGKQLTILDVKSQFTVKRFKYCMDGIVKDGSWCLMKHIDALTGNQLSHFLNILSNNTSETAAFRMFGTSNFSKCSEYDELISFKFKKISINLPDINESIQRKLTIHCFKSSKLIAEKAATVVQILKSQMTVQGCNELNMTLFNNVIKNALDHLIDINEMDVANDDNHENENIQGLQHGCSPKFDESRFHKEEYCVAKAVSEALSNRICSRDCLILQHALQSCFSYNKSDVSGLSSVDGLPSIISLLGEDNSSNAVVNVPQVKSAIKQLFQMSNDKRCVAIIGPSASGKSTVIETTILLINKLSEIQTVDDASPHNKHTHQLIPVLNESHFKSLEGYFDKNDQWIDGLLPHTMKREYAEMDTRIEFHPWFHFDVSDCSIMNSALVDFVGRKVFNYGPCQSMELSSNMQFVFETVDICNLTPSLCAQMGIIPLGQCFEWRYFISKWLSNQQQSIETHVQHLVDVFIVDVMQLSKDIFMQGEYQPSDMVIITGFIQLLQSFFSIDVEKGFNEENIERVFVYCLAWSLGAWVTDRNRRSIISGKILMATKFCQGIADNGILFDYSLDENMKWIHLNTIPDPSFIDQIWHDTALCYKTQAMVEYESMFKHLKHHQVPNTLIFGGRHCGRSSFANELATQNGQLRKIINCFSSSSFNTLQNAIDENVTHKFGNIYSSSCGGSLNYLLDDIHLPSADNNQTGFIPGLRFLAEHEMSYDARWPFHQRKIRSMSLIATADLSSIQKVERILRHFVCLRLPELDSEALSKIFSCFFKGIDEQIRISLDDISIGTAEIYLLFKRMMTVDESFSKNIALFNLEKLISIFNHLSLLIERSYLNNATLTDVWHQQIQLSINGLVNEKSKCILTEKLQSIVNKRFGMFELKEKVWLLPHANSNELILRNGEDSLSWVMSMLKNYGLDLRMDQLFLFRESVLHLCHQLSLTLSLPNRNFKPHTYILCGSNSKQVENIIQVMSRHFVFEYITLNGDCEIVIVRKLFVLAKSVIEDGMKIVLFIKESLLYRRPVLESFVSLFLSGSIGAQSVDNTTTDVLFNCDCQKLKSNLRLIVMSDNETNLLERIDRFSPPFFKLFNVITIENGNETFSEEQINTVLWYDADRNNGLFNAGDRKRFSGAVSRLYDDLKMSQFNCLDSRTNQSKDEPILMKKMKSLRDDDRVFFNMKSFKIDSAWLQKMIATSRNMISSKGIKRLEKLEIIQSSFSSLNEIEIQCKTIHSKAEELKQSVGSLSRETSKLLKKRWEKSSALENFKQKHSLDDGNCTDVEMEMNQNRIMELSHDLRCVKESFDDVNNQKRKIDEQLKLNTISLNHLKQLLDNVSVIVPQWKESKAELENHSLFLGNCFIASAFLTFGTMLNGFQSDHFVEILHDCCTKAGFEYDIEIVTNGNKFSEFLDIKNCDLSYQLLDIPSDTQCLQQLATMSYLPLVHFVVDPFRMAILLIKRAYPNIKVVSFQELFQMDEDFISTQSEDLMITDVDPSLIINHEHVMNNVHKRFQAFCKVDGEDIILKRVFFLTTNSVHKIPIAFLRFVNLIDISFVSCDSLTAIFHFHLLSREKLRLKENRRELLQGKLDEINAIQTIELDIATKLSHISYLCNIGDVKAILSMLRRRKDHIQSLNELQSSLQSLGQSISSYRPIANRAATIFDTSCRMTMINPQYTTCIGMFLSHFNFPVKFPDREPLEAVVERTQRYLFSASAFSYNDEDRHVFAMMYAIEIERLHGRVHTAEVEFLIDPHFGEFTKQRSVPKQPISITRKPLDWMSTEQYQQLLTLAENFNWFTDVFEKLMKEGREMQWRLITEHETPERVELPDSLDSRCSPLQRLMILRALRNDRLIDSFDAFIQMVLGKRYSSLSPIDVSSIHQISSSRIPIVLTYENDLSIASLLVKQLASDAKAMLLIVHLYATSHTIGEISNLIIDTMNKGRWLLLVGVHHCVSSVIKIPNIIQSIKTVNINARIWMVHNMKQQLPCQLLQSSVQLCVESCYQPVRTSLCQTLSCLGKQVFSRSNSNIEKSLLFNITVLHSAMKLRKRFANVALLEPDAFCLTAEDIKTFGDYVFHSSNNYTQAVDKNKPSDIDNNNNKSIPWNKLRYILATHYCGRQMKNKHDQRAMLYLIEFWISFNSCNKEFTSFKGRYRLPALIHQPMVDLQGLLKWIDQHYNNRSLDFPEFCGMVTSCETYLSHEQYALSAINFLLDNNLKYSHKVDYLSPNPPMKIFSGENHAKGAGTRLLMKKSYMTSSSLIRQSSSSALKDVCEMIYRKLPKLWSQEFVNERIVKFGGATQFNLFLLSEIDSFSTLIRGMRSTVEGILKGLHHQHFPLDPSLVEDASYLIYNRVPLNWISVAKQHESVNIAVDVSEWLSNILARISFIESLLIRGRENTVSFWSGAFFDPSRFFSVILEENVTIYEQHSQFVEKLTLIGELTGKDKDHIKEPPNDGCFIHGLVLWSASIDKATLSLLPMPLSKSTPYQLSAIHIKLVPNARKSQSKKSEKPCEYFNCPCYHSPLRKGDPLFYIRLPYKDISYSKLNARSISCSLTDM